MAPVFTVVSPTARYALLQLPISIIHYAESVIPQRRTALTIELALLIIIAVMVSVIDAL